MMHFARGSPGTFRGGAWRQPYRNFYLPQFPSTAFLLPPYQHFYDISGQEAAAGYNKITLYYCFFALRLRYGYTMIAWVICAGAFHSLYHGRNQP